jgi:pyruvate/2-oxoglutarate dehydrogenase complex dihydrolipoamide acyltransferase (E2) component
MPLDVIMPALGMAQDTGVIVRWLKAPGDAVAEGDALFEVETDKATMEVEAQGAGYLTGVVAEVGAEVPVGQTIAHISKTPEDAASAPEGTARTPDAAKASDSDATPVGEQVIMPALGMAQDTGLIVVWRKEPGAPVLATDILFEVETDKSTVEVEAGHDGFVAALLAEAGEEVPVGDVIALISAQKPDAPVSRSIKDGASVVAEPAPVAGHPAPKAEKPSTGPTAKAQDGRILASPKVRRLALERGLDLARLVKAGHPQPYHVKDLELLIMLPAATDPTTVSAGAARHLTADVPSDAFAAFAIWAADEAGMSDVSALLAGLAAASLGKGDITVAVETFGKAYNYAVSGRRLGAVTNADKDAMPDLRLRDLRNARLSAVQMGAEEIPVLSIMAAGDGLMLTLECSAEHLSALDAITFLTDFAGRMEQPLRHLL